MLKKMNLSPNGVLLIHSSFKSFKRDGYHPNDALSSIMEYMGNGTLLMPTMSWRYVKPQNPYFYVSTTPSNTGILTELFRQQFAQHRSLHPTHSVAGVGKDAYSILNQHHYCDTPCGNNSPFAKLIESDAYIIMLGVGIDCCTLIHHAEELIATQHYVKPESEVENYTCIDRYDNVSTVRLRRHLFLPRNYWQFQDQLAYKKKLQVFSCDNSICIGFRAKELFAIVKQVLNNKPDAIIAKPGERYRMM